MSLRIEDIPLSKFDLSLSEMRVMNIARVAQVEKSMRMHGQLQAVVARLCNGNFQMIDGFKRLYVAQDLMMETLQCRVLEIDLRQAKVITPLINLTTKQDKMLPPFCKVELLFDL